MPPAWRWSAPHRVEIRTTPLSEGFTLPIEQLAVVTEEGHRGKGWAQRLVTQAARQVLADGAVPTYLHAPDNVASARTADASGFPDVGWRIFGLFGAETG